MDREQVDKLPDLQVDFIDDICMPVYDVSHIFFFSMENTL